MEKTASSRWGERMMWFMFGFYPKIGWDAMARGFARQFGGSIVKFRYEFKDLFAGETICA